ncbi:unnamed protein product, partial [Brassica oleracea]
LPVTLDWRHTLSCKKDSNAPKLKHFCLIKGKIVQKLSWSS